MKSPKPVAICPECWFIPSWRLVMNHVESIAYWEHSSGYRISIDKELKNEIPLFYWYKSEIYLAIMYLRCFLYHKALRWCFNHLTRWGICNKPEAMATNGKVTYGEGINKRQWSTQIIRDETPRDTGNYPLIIIRSANFSLDNISTKYLMKQFGICSHTNKYITRLHLNGTKPYTQC